MAQSVTDDKDLFEALPQSSPSTATRTSQGTDVTGSTASSPPTGAPSSNPRLAQLLQKKTKLEHSLEELERQRDALVETTCDSSGQSSDRSWSQQDKYEQAMSAANGVIKEHIRLLHDYNEIKDIAQGLMGLIADGRGKRVGEVMEDFGMNEKD